jgi:serine/threonine protein kinase
MMVDAARGLTWLHRGDFVVIHRLDCLFVPCVDRLLLCMFVQCAIGHKRLCVLLCIAFADAFCNSDLKPENLLVDENYRVKVCDFGLSQVKEKPNEDLMDPKVRCIVVWDRKLTTMYRQGRLRGSPLWMAPEVLAQQPFSQMADVYAYALVKRLWNVLPPSACDSDARTGVVGGCHTSEALCTCEDAQAGAFVGLVG